MKYDRARSASRSDAGEIMNRRPRRGGGGRRNYERAPVCGSAVSPKTAIIRPNRTLFTNARVFDPGHLSKNPQSAIRNPQFPKIRPAVALLRRGEPNQGKPHFALVPKLRFGADLSAK